MDRIEKTFEVDAPLQECYKTWIDFEHYPRFVQNLKSIRRKGAPHVWHWEVLGPENTLLNWDVEMDASQHNNRIISWHTVRDADIVHSGALTLEPVDNKQKTRMHLVIQFSAGMLESTEWEQETVEKYLEKTLEQSISQFKMLMEQSVASARLKFEGE